MADPRLGNEADNIGKGRTGSVAADIYAGTVSQRRNSAIYNDRSITFEDYRHWADRSRAFEKTLDTKGTGLEGSLRLVLGKGSHSKTPVQTIGDAGSGSENEKTVRRDGEDAYGITESEWDNAQRAIRTATWGTSNSATCKTALG